MGVTDKRWRKGSISVLCGVIILSLGERKALEETLYTMCFGEN